MRYNLIGSNQNVSGKIIATLEEKDILIQLMPTAINNGWFSLEIVKEKIDLELTQYEISLLRFNNFNGVRSVDKISCTKAYKLRTGVSLVDSLNKIKEYIHTNHPSYLNS
jgi:hypothetical protein